MTTATRPNRLGIEQRIFESEARLDALASLIDAENRALMPEERQERDGIVAELPGLRSDLGFIQERQRREREAPSHEDDNVEADRRSSQIPAGSKDVKVFPTLGHQLAAIYNATVNHDTSARTQLLAAAGASEAIDSDGGFMVQSDFASGIERRMHDTGSLLRLMSPIEVSGNGLVERVIDETSRANGSRSGGVRGYWVDEGDEITGSRPKFAKRETKLQKVGALGYSTDELLEDFPAMSSLFTEEFAEELLFKVEDAIIEGDGAVMPLGILAATCLITVAKETGQAADTFVSANISQMMNRFPVRNRANAVWLANQELEPQLDVLTIPVGTAGVAPPFVTRSPDGEVLRIKGRPVVFLEYCSALGDLGDIILADLSEYRLIRKGGVAQASSMHVRFVTDEMAFRATMRVGGQPKWRTALTPFKATSGRTVSPFVTLAAR